MTTAVLIIGLELAGSKAKSFTRFFELIEKKSAVEIRFISFRSLKVTRDRQHLIFLS